MVQLHMCFQILSSMCWEVHAAAFAICFIKLGRNNGIWREICMTSARASFWHWSFIRARFRRRISPEEASTSVEMEDKIIYL